MKKLKLYPKADNLMLTIDKEGAKEGTLLSV